MTTTDQRTTQFIQQITPTTMTFRRPLPFQNFRNDFERFEFQQVLTQVIKINVVFENRTRRQRRIVNPLWDRPSNPRNLETAPSFKGSHRNRKQSTRANINWSLSRDNDGRDWRRTNVEERVRKKGKYLSTRCAAMSSSLSSSSFLPLPSSRDDEARWRLYSTSWQRYSCAIVR